jgi:predicted exporter
VRSSGRLAFAISALVLLLTAAYVWPRLRVTSDVSLLLPEGGDREALAVWTRVADSELARSMVLMIGAADVSDAVSASRAFEAELRAEPRVGAQLAALDGGPQQGSERAVYELYHPRRLAFFADSEADARVASSGPGLRSAAQRLKAQLEQPLSPLISQLAPSDPTLSVVHLFERVQVSHGAEMTLQEGRFVTRGEPWAVLFLRTRARAFDSKAQAPLLEGIGAAFARVNERFGGRLKMEQSGANRFAVQMERAISGDLSRVSTLSMLGLGALLFALFRSARLLFAAAIPLGAGTLVGTAVTLAVYGSVHGVTLAFGASLLGVALDYVEHLYCHHAVAPNPAGPAGTLRAIGPALVTGAVTTLIGFVALGGSGFRGLEEVALFSSSGLAAALITTFTMLPAVLPRGPSEVALRTRIVARLSRWFEALRAQRSRLWILPAVAVIVSIVGLRRAHMSEDFMLGQLDPTLLAEDNRVRGRVARFEEARFVLALGADEEQALQVNDQVAEQLQAAVARGELGGFQSVARLLPSAARQVAVERAARAQLGDGQALLAALEAEGFRPEAFDPFAAQLKTAAPPPLRYADVLESPLAPLVRPLRVTLGERVGFLSFLRDVRDPSALGRALSAVQGAQFVDQRAQLKAAYLAYQQRTLQLLIAGALGVFLLLLARYRDLRKTLAAFLPSVLGAVLTLALLSFLGHGIDLVALAALLMVVSMGVDYGVFLVDASESAAEEAIALLSVLLAATTTVLGFGLLALSVHPMLRVIGLTAWVGMTACALLAPTTLVLLGRGSAAPVHRREVQP